MTIYIIETPHQGAAYCWTATDQREFIGAADSGSKAYGLPEDATFGEACRYLAEGLQDLTMYESTDDAAAAYLVNPEPLMLSQLRSNRHEITDMDVQLRVVQAFWGMARRTEREISGEAYEVIKDAALTMPETKIAEALGVDRMTVRRALGKR